MHEFVGLLDVNGTTLEINRAALEGAGISLGTIRGRPFWEARWWAVSRQTQEMQKDLVRRAREGEFIRCDMEIYGQASGEETIIIDYSLQPIRDRHPDKLFIMSAVCSDEIREMTLMGSRNALPTDFAAPNLGIVGNNR